MNEKIGVIVPVYKTEKYIAECIESILAQTYTNFRLILVDDGTPDGAGAICDEYATKDPRITVIHQENAGVTRARARGVEEATDCEWITFVDSDDKITPNALESLHTVTTKKEDVDIVLSDSNKVDAKPLKGVFVNIIDYRKLIIKNCWCEPWGKLFRKTLFNDFTFSIPRNIIIGEDLIMNLRLAFNTHKDVEILHNSIYNYRIHTGSTYNLFVNTLEYTQKLHTQKMLSIPTETRKEYIEATIEQRLMVFKNFYGYKYSSKGMKCSSFYNEIKIDIKECGYKLTFIERIIFYNTNPIIRFFAINTKKIINILKRY